MIPGMEGLLPWIVLAIVVGLLGVALWLWRRRYRPNQGRVDDPVASRLRFQGAQIGATSNRTYKKRKSDSVPVVRFSRDVDEKVLVTDGADVTAKLAEADEATPPHAFQFQLRDEKVTYTSNGAPQPKEPKALRFKRAIDLWGTGYPVVELDEWFELQDHVVFFVTTRGTFSTRTPDVWVVAIGDLLKNRTND